MSLWCFHWFPAKTMSDVEFLESLNSRHPQLHPNCIYEWQAKERCSGWECRKKMDLRPRWYADPRRKERLCHAGKLQRWEGTNTVENRHHFGPQYNRHCILLEGLFLWPFGPQFGPILMKRRGYCCNKPKFIVKMLIPPIHQYKITQYGDISANVA